jgi:hypothetical protein
VNGFKQRSIQPGGFFTLDRLWKPGDTVNIIFTMNIRLERGFHDSVAVSRGPLVFSLKIGEKWKKLAVKGQTADWAVEPKGPWNFALKLNGRVGGLGMAVEIHKMGANPFTPEGTPVVIRALGKRVPYWNLVNGSAGPVPVSPVAAGGPIEHLELIPFAAAKLRITAFPVLKN